jgi:hypothetical protein
MEFRSASFDFGYPAIEFFLPLFGESNHHFGGIGPFRETGFVISDALLHFLHPFRRDRCFNTALIFAKHFGEPVKELASLFATQVLGGFEESVNGW